MSLSPLEYLRHVLDEAAYLAEQVERITRQKKILRRRATKCIINGNTLSGELSLT